LVASGDTAGDVFVWEAATGQVVHRYRGRHTGISDIAFSPDGRLLAIASFKPLVVLDTASYKQLFALRGDPQFDPTFSRLAFSPDGKLLAATAHGFEQKAAKNRRESSTIPVWNMESGALLRELPGGALDLAFSPDGKLLASGKGRELGLWDTSTWTRLHVVPVPPGVVKDPERIRQWQDFCRKNKRWCDGPPEQAFLNITSLAFSPDGQQVAAAVANVVILWQVATWQLAHTLAAHAGDVSGIAFSPDDRWLVSMEERSSERTIFWDTASGQLVKSLENREGGMQMRAKQFAFAPDGKLLALPRVTGDVQLVDPAGPEVVLSFGGTRTLGAVGDWRLLRRGQAQASPQPPRGMTFDISLRGDWQYWTIEIDLENHADQSGFFVAPMASRAAYLLPPVMLIAQDPKGSTEGNYPLLSVLPGDETAANAKQGGPGIAVNLGKYGVQVPASAVTFGPHQTLTLRLVFVAPAKYPAQQLMFNFGGAMLAVD
jgi:WD40 repeat protein